MTEPTLRELQIVLGMVRAGMGKDPSRAQTKMADEGIRRAQIIGYGGKTHADTVRNLTAAIELESSIERGRAIQDGGSDR